MKDDITDVLNTLMEKIESWRIATISSICASQQEIAFHIATLTEEKFRVYALTGHLLTQESLTSHVEMREDIFAAEWALRSLQLPDHNYIEIKKLRNSWNDNTANKCIKFLIDLSNYNSIRDLVICAKRGGFIVEVADDYTFVFKDIPNWTGTKDIKSRLISANISKKRNKDLDQDILASGSLRATSLYDDFPHGLRTSDYTGADFWRLWEWLFNLSVIAFDNSSKVHSNGSSAVTTETKELTILITKKTIMDRLVQETGLSKSNIEIFLKWLTFNSQTPRKFTLFHCPLIEINDKFLMILPHSVLMAHPPTIFLRLLAHYDKIVLDSASSDLERQTLNRLKTHLEGQGHIIKTNVKLDTPEKEAEFDFIEYDESNTTLSIGQAKLTVRADSVSEVDQTNEVLKEGIAQLKRNKDMLNGNQSNMKILLEKMGVPYSDNVAVDYFLLPTIFTGSDFLQEPTWIKILPVEFCLCPQYKGYSIHSVWIQYKTLWDSLDETVTSSHTSQAEFEIAGFKIRYPGFVI